MQAQGAQILCSLLKPIHAVDDEDAGEAAETAVGASSRTFFVLLETCTTY